MSAEANDSADMAKKGKKRKKNKGYTDNNTKKRKREEQEAEEEVAAEEPSGERASKKHKKDRESTETNPKKRKQSDGENREHAIDDQLEARTSKKYKKDHKKTKSTVQPVKPRRSLLEQHSPFMKQTTSFYLALSPCTQHFPLEGLCAEHISPLLLTYFPPLKGILLSYEHPRISEQPSGDVQVNSSDDNTAILSQSINEYGVTFIWLTAEFTIFRPRKGTFLEGVVNVQNESMLGLVCYNYFNAMIERDKLPKDWKWVDNGDEGAQVQKKRRRALQGAGHFEDGEGEEIEGKIVFKVIDFEANPGSDGGPGTVSIIGTLRFDDET